MSKTYDEKCWGLAESYDEETWELAEHFLAAESFRSVGHRIAATNELAIRIQNCCEDFCDEIKAARDRRVLGHDEGAS